MSERRRIGFVGGIERIRRQIVAFGEQLGVEVEVHNGRTGGSGISRLEALVQRTDFVVIVTGTNSHNAVQIAKREAAKAGVPFQILTFCGAAAARAAVASVAGAARALHMT